ncbi:hypothetical protein DU504_01930 [Haloplanus salinus]|uniref:Uncharacterized protein n=1 Tax=Haloplanus salinus TaxID=1126245 RepID=A0A368N9E1_9EURY|nr:hypothetical protein DU504_01930 [Haloplanus salinus]
MFGRKDPVLALVDDGRFGEEAAGRPDDRPDANLAVEFVRPLDGAVAGVGRFEAGVGAEAPGEDATDRRERRPSCRHSPGRRVSPLMTLSVSRRRSPPADPRTFYHPGV